MACSFQNERNDDEFAQLEMVGGTDLAWWIEHDRAQALRIVRLLRDVQRDPFSGAGKPEPLKDGGLGLGNIWIAKDLIEALEKDRQPLGSMYDGRAALEMILAVYESYRLRGTAELPLKNRKHPLTML